MTATPWPDAHACAYDAAAALPPTTVPVPVAAGLVLAAPVVARAPVPPFDVSAMDGFAVAGPGPWRLVGQVRAGDAARPALEPSTAVEIATGAVVPGAADAVLPYEHAERRGDSVSGDVGPGRHIRRTGEETASGEPVLAAGSALTPVALGLVASVGLDEVAVVPRPRVAVVVTGDELLTHGVPGHGHVRDALGPMLPSLLTGFGADVISVCRANDDAGLLRDAIRAGLDTAEVVAVTGSSSRGPADHLRDVLAALRGEPLVTGVACRPGHPQSLTRLPGNRWVVGLPGNPLAAVVAAATLLRPLLAALGGRAHPALPEFPAGEDLSAHPQLTRLVPAAVGDGHLRLLPHDRPAMLRSAALDDVLAVVPPGNRVPSGTWVRTLPLPLAAPS